MLRIAVPLAAATLFASSALAADDGDLYAPSLWDLTLGAHASDLPLEEFGGYACGTNGGPPSTPVIGWLDYAKCPKETTTGLHEVYFKYDNEPEYIARAKSMLNQISIFE